MLEALPFLREGHIQVRKWGASRCWRPCSCLPCMRLAAGKLMLKALPFLQKGHIQVGGRTLLLVAPACLHKSHVQVRKGSASWGWRPYLPCTRAAFKWVRNPRRAWLSTGYTCGAAGVLNSWLTKACTCVCMHAHNKSAHVSACAPPMLPTQADNNKQQCGHLHLYACSSRTAPRSWCCLVPPTRNRALGGPPPLRLHARPGQVAAALQHQARKLCLRTVGARVGLVTGRKAAGQEAVPLRMTTKKQAREGCHTQEYQLHLQQQQQQNTALTLLCPTTAAAAGAGRGSRGRCMESRGRPRQEQGAHLSPPQARQEKVPQSGQPFRRAHLCPTQFKRAKPHPGMQPTRVWHAPRQNLLLPLWHS